MGGKGISKILLRNPKSGTYLINMHSWTKADPCNRKVALFGLNMKVSRSINIRIGKEDKTYLIKRYFKMVLMKYN